MTRMTRINYSFSPPKMYIYAFLRAIHPLFLHKTIKIGGIFVYYYIFICTFAAHFRKSKMKKKTNRLDTIKMLISSREICSQEELLDLLDREGMGVTQATLSRDLKQLKVAKASSMTGKYVYVLPNSTVYRRLPDKDSPVQEMMKYTGFVSINFSYNMAVIRTRPGYASSLAYDIDNQELSEIVGTIAGDDTILLVIREGVTHDQVRHALHHIIHNQI